MTDYKFKKGDRVRYTGDGTTVSKGAIGTVTEDDDYPYVRWDNFSEGLPADRSVWAVADNLLELVVEPSVEAFKIGQRVRVSIAGSYYDGEEGTVEVGNYAQYVAVRLDGYDYPKMYFNPSQLTSIQQAPESPAKPECYVTAWVEEGDFHLTGDVLVTKQDADASANLLVGCNPGREVAVLKMVSKHSSAVTVTSEDV